MRYFVIAAGTELIQFVRTDEKDAWCFATKDITQNRVYSVTNPPKYKLRTYLTSCTILEIYNNEIEFLGTHFEVML